MKLKKIMNNSYLLVVTLFVFSLFIISPWGNHGVNDDWAFFVQTKFFMEGEYSKIAQIDPSFVTQGIFGMLWSKFVGISFVNLRLLTILITFITLYGIYKILKLFSVNKKITLLALLTIAFNPLFYTSSLSYMTEIYFLGFALWSIYFFIGYLKQEPKLKKFAFSIVLAGLSLLVRQLGLVLFISFFLTLMYTSWIERRIRILEFCLLLGSLLIFSYPAFYWPKYSDPYASLTSESEEIENMIKMTPYLLGYFAFFISPFLVGLIFKLRYRLLILFGLISTPLTMMFYRKDIFPIGNVFYIENLYGKTNFFHFLHLFDNIPFKVFLSWYISFLIVDGAFLLFKKTLTWIKDFDLKKVPTAKFLLKINFLGMVGIVYASVFLAGDFFERYFINAFVLLILIVAANLSELKPNKLSFLALILLSLITVFLSWDFYSSEELLWKMGKTVKSELGLERNEVYVNGVFSRYEHYSKFESPEDVYDFSKKKKRYKCFISFYTKEENTNLLWKVLHRFENSRTLNKYIKNPKIYNNKTAAEIELLEWHWDDIFYEETYYSPIYSLLGVEPVLAAYCR